MPFSEGRAESSVSEGTTAEVGVWKDVVRVVSLPSLNVARFGESGGGGGGTA